DTSGNADANLVEVSATTAASADVKAPTFGGLASATASSRTSLALAWADASDDFSLPADITYDVYVATAAGAEVFTSTTRFIKGATSYTVTGLTANTTYFVVVRAKDEAGNEEKNVIEKSAKTLP
ncbi:MAG: fibronectin type III domain-containing protein, partial [Polyangiales bacterium]